MLSECASQKRQTVRNFLVSLAVLMLMASVTAIAAEPAVPPKPPRIHAVSDIGHQFSFYADGRFHSQYLPGQPRAMSWGALYNYDFSNANMLILLGCDSHLEYLTKDITTIKKFLIDGGGVVLLGSAGDKQQNKLAAVFGCTFQGRAKKPLKGNLPKMNEEIKGNVDWIKIKKPQSWEVLITDADSKPILVRKKAGKGNLLIGARGLAGSNPNAKDNINAVWWKPLLVDIASGEKVDPKKPFRSRGLGELEYTESLGSIKLHYCEYLKPYATAMADIYQRTKPVMRQRMGVPLSDGMAGEIGLLSTGGGGFSSGRMLGLAVFWGGFPEREDGMIEFITHETVHSWVLPFAEIWNEPIATYVGDLVMIDMGHEEEGMKRIRNNIDRAKRIDPTMKLYDLSGKSFKDGVEPLTGGQANNMHWGKTFWIFEELRKENPDVVADYFKAKRKHAIPGQIKKYDANATVAVMSVAMGRDMFPWFREHGFDVSRDDSSIKIEF
ncbi:MAG: hypothetical protein KAS23_11945 [Anaerohalosphaera sp.]|nr:hypothetical protein [Anaerohalosphaera sp.]